VLMRLSATSPDDLAEVAELLSHAWNQVAPKRVVDQTKATNRRRPAP
jgi:hypothetical protein